MAKHSTNTLLDVVGIPANLLAGFVAGAVMPVAAVAALAAGVRLLTGKVPFLTRVVPDAEGERQLVLELVTPEEARALWAEHKSSFGAPLDKLRLEIQAMAEQAGAEAPEDE
ncbi:MAG TPA: hypothetical protein PKO09_07805 [Anaerolineae bacterium]|nr:hypothetical protein [Anaerolineae bacterium]